MKYLYILQRPNMEDVYALSFDELVPLMKDYTEKYISQCTIMRKIIIQKKEEDKL